MYTHTHTHTEVPLLLRQLGLETPEESIAVLVKHYKVIQKPGIVDAASLLAALRSAAA
jgi:hypothetical protein